ncbi:Wzy polymerase domain-containing protein [Pseudomonas peli]|uniref:PglL family O-oligosaccharyltransferase n=1 Tax=Pseudomonas peli TaxID=592361 RepID=UPI003D31A2D1
MSSVYRLSFFWAAVFIVVAWLLPNHTVPWLTAYQDFFAFFALFSVSACFFYRGGGFTSSMLFIFIFSLVPIFYFLFGVTFFLSDSLMAFFYISSFSVAIFAGFNLGQTNSSQVCVWLSSVFVFASLVSCFIAIAQWLGLSSGMWVVDIQLGGRPYANLAQPNNLATLLCMGLGGLIYLFERKFFGAFVSGIIAFILIFGVVLTQSRTPWVGAVFSLVWWWWKGEQFRIGYLHMAGWVLVYASLTIGYPIFSESIGLSLPGLLERASQMQRFELWAQFVYALFEGPLWGYGWGQVSVAQALVSLDKPFALPTEHAHNIVLDLMLWCGPLVGGVVVLALGGWLMLTAVKVRRSESVLLFLIVGFVLIHSMLEFPLEYAFFLLPVGFMLGVIIAETESSAGKVPRPLFLGFWVSCLAVFFLVFFEYRKVEEDYRLMRFEDLKIGTLKADRDAPDVVMLSGLRELIRFSRFEYLKEMSVDELAWMRQVAYRNPYSYTLFRLGVALALSGEIEEANSEFLRLRALHGEVSFDRAMVSLDVLAEKYPALLLLSVMHKD